MPTAAEVRETVLTPTTHDFWETLLKISSERRKIHEKQHKRLKVAYFYPIGFGNSNSYRNIGN